MSERVGIFKVRTVGRNEQVIRVPHTLTGEFVLYVEDDGTLRYVPVRQ
jgi:hypothetical protein